MFLTTSQLSTDNNLESCPRVTILTSTSNIPNGTAALLDVGPQTNRVGHQCPIG